MLFLFLGECVLTGRTPSSGDRKENCLDASLPGRNYSGGTDPDFHGIPYYANAAPLLAISATTFILSRG
jgi:hypothetical protein